MKKLLLLLTFIVLTVSYISCSKNEPSPPSDPCSGVTISVTGTITHAGAGLNNGAISAVATGGSGITYSIDGGAYQASGDFSNLAAGAHTVSAKSAAGCTGSAQFTVTTINPCAGVTVNVTGVVVNAGSGNSDGSITLTATGGTGFTYSINNGTFQAGNVFSNLAAGVYTIVAKNSNGCTGTAQFTVVLLTRARGSSLRLTQL